MSQDEHKKLIDKIKGTKKGRQFEPYIEFIQLSNYKNFDPETFVKFPFPVTALVGANGCGKTSVLHALDGAPKGKSLGKWWFGTEVDSSTRVKSEPAQSIEGKNKLSESEKASFWYQYSNESELFEARKTRVNKPGDPDYWEPSRPAKMYGMREKKDGSRDPQIVKNSVYMNFKTQMNAFDHCFYFAPTSQMKEFAKTGVWKKFNSKHKKMRTMPRVQDFLRHRSKTLKTAFKSNSGISHGPNKLSHPAIPLSDQMLSDISTIIGKKYSSGAIVKHRIYGQWGLSVRFSTHHISYSEAYSGSGESAVARLVYEISEAPEGTLLLLDEPETSLHPGAQQNLIQYLVQSAFSKKLQIVMATHSPTIVKMLPDEAVNVFSLNPKGNVVVEHEVKPIDAFHVLGHTSEAQTKIIVEDQLAKLLLDTVIKNHCRESIGGNVDVIFRPSGVGGILNYAAQNCHDQSLSILYCLDGDAKKENFPFNTEEFDHPKTTSEEIANTIEATLGNRPNILCNSSDEEDAKKTRWSDFAKYLNKRLMFLPFNTPEEELWDEKTAKAYLSVVYMGSAERLNEYLQDIEKLKCFKNRFKTITKLVSNSSDAGSILQSQKMFLSAWSERLPTSAAMLAKEIEGRV